MEPKQLNSNPESLFADVRRAYRLLYLYQRRVMDLMKFIGDYYSFIFNKGYSHFSNIAIRSGSNSLNLWAWDWLNMYHYQFHFQPKIIEKQQIQLAVFLVSDTGFYDADLTAWGDKLNIKAFASPEEADTCLVFLAGKGDVWHDQFPEFKDNYKKGAADFIRNNDKGCIVAKSFSLTGFFDEPSTVNALQEFTALCAKNSIPELGAWVSKV